MKDHDILYKKQMLQAKKNGWKIVTRRPIKPQPKDTKAAGKPVKKVDDYFTGVPENGQAYYWREKGSWNSTEPFHCPYGTPGDRLYTKENFQIHDCSDFEQSVLVEYTADGCERWVQLTNREWEKYRAWKEPFGKKSKLFMFKSLSRFWDEVTEIDIERVQDISGLEAKNEGIKLDFPGGHHGAYKRAKNDFFELWQEMYADTQYALSNNPWVWVVRYKPLVVNGRRTDLENELATATNS